MRKLLVLILAAGVAAASITGCSGKKIGEIRVDVGKNIVDTASDSGVPQFEVRKIATRLDYSVANITEERAHAHFVRPGHEIDWGPVSSFAMYAYPDQNNNFQVGMALIQLNTKNLKTHPEAQAFLEKTLTQFNNGKWKRHFRAQDARLTGRSSMLNEAGQLDMLVTGSLDPTYRIPAQDWVNAASQNPTWRWFGDGVLATLEVGFSENGVQGLIYKMSLTFELLSQNEQRTRAEQEQMIKEGGDPSTPWSNAAKYQAEVKLMESRNKVLEANAVKRGDKVVPK